ncbi:protein of unknown function [Paenibacillus alvei]|uniref:Uncharacterized protein n=1 Tax=Paenibacillus alvei TaxID=44250 RepID=A0A383RD09_PAEAL|nr:protein of unknown function [Paenibacillus alvei]
MRERYMDKPISLMANQGKGLLLDVCYLPIIGLEDYIGGL